MHLGLNGHGKNEDIETRGSKNKGENVKKRLPVQEVSERRDYKQKE